MFNILKKAFKTNDLFQEAFNEMVTMLHEDYTMFRESVRSLRHSDNAELEFDLYAADKKINKFEREVRRKVLTQLAIAKPIDIAPGLILISVVGDIERIGDYTKNIYELADAHPKILHAGKFEEKLVETEKTVMEKFQRVTKAYSQKDEALAGQIMLNHRSITEWCDKTVKEMITSKDCELSCGDAVAVALYIRHLKRISSHLSNIVSSIINPFPRVGYRNKEDLDD
ncbi:MAG: PhoU domain-containing protein [Candidatus Zixiibacteriota bacterium]